MTRTAIVATVAVLSFVAGFWLCAWLLDPFVAWDRMLPETVDGRGAYNGNEWYRNSIGPNEP